ncbi:hypothetical protein D3C76_1762270 [compost metagenome]
MRLGIHSERHERGLPEFGLLDDPDTASCAFLEISLDGVEADRHAVEDLGLHQLVGITRITDSKIHPAF